MEQNFTFFLEEFKKKTRTDSVVFLVNSLIIYYVEVHEVMETTWATLHVVETEP